MKAEKKSSFLKGLKRKHSKSPRHTKMAPNSTKVGQGEGIIERPFDVAKKRAEQANKGKNEPNGERSNYSKMLIAREAEKAKKSKRRVKKTEKV